MTTGILLPNEVLASGWFAVLSAFVAINTLLYVTLAIAKMFPRLYPRDWLRRHNSRSETRSIYPDAPIGGPRRSRAKRRH